jgi:hypothetical protein
LQAISDANAGGLFHALGGKMSSMNDSPKTKRPWYQFSLRTMFVVVALTAILCSQWPPIETAFIYTKAQPAGPEQVYSYRRPRRDFVIVLGAEILGIIGWWYWQRWKERQARRVPGT